MENENRNSPYNSKHGSHHTRFSDRRLVIVSLLIFVIPTGVLSELWLQNQQPLWAFSAYGKATSVALSSDGSYLAVGLQTNTQEKSGRVVLLDKAGTVLWAHNSSSVITSVAITSDGSHLAASGVTVKVLSQSPVALQQTGAVYYFDHSGNQLWNYSTPLHYVNYPGSWNPPLFRVMMSRDGSRIVVDTGTGTLVFDGSGRLLWGYSPTCGYTICPWPTLVSADASFIVSVNEQVHAFDGSGVSLWNSSIPSESQLQNAVMSGDGKYVALEWEDTFAYNSRPTLILLDKSGTQLWNRTLSSITSTLTMSGDDSTILMSPSGRIVSVDPTNRLLWNSTTGPSNLAVTTLHGTYSAIVVALGLGDYTVRILDGSGRSVWGFGQFGEVDALALSADDSYLAVAGGPDGSYSANSATVVLLPGPMTLATRRGSTYALFTFDPNTQDWPWLFVLPAVFASIPVVYLLFRWTKASRSRVERVEGPQNLKAQANP